MEEAVFPPLIQSIIAIIPKHKHVIFTCQRLAAVELTL